MLNIQVWFNVSVMMHTSQSSYILIYLHFFGGSQGASSTRDLLNSCRGEPLFGGF